MKTRIISSILLMVTVSSSITMAQGSVPSPEPTASVPVSIPTAPPIQIGEPDVGPAISPLKKGQQSPFTGVLLSPAAVASIIADINHKNDLIKVEVDKATKTLTAKHEFDTNLLKLRTESDAKISQMRIEEQRKEIDRIDAQLKKEREDRPNPMTWAAIGLGTGILISTLTAATIAYVTKN